MKTSIPKVLLAVALTTTSIATVQAAKPGQASHTAASELTWVESGFGPLVSPVYGDFSSNRHVTYIKFPAGMATPLHTHSHDYIGIVITGVSMHWEPGRPKTKKQLSAGAHWFMPANVPHVSECLPGVDCVMAISQQKHMDFLPVGQ